MNKDPDIEGSGRKSKHKIKPGAVRCKRAYESEGHGHEDREETSDKEGKGQARRLWPRTKPTGPEQRKKESVRVCVCAT